MKRPTVMLAASDGLDQPTTTHVAQLARLLADRGYRPRVALIRGGDRVRELRHDHHVIVADHTERRGIGRLLRAVGRPDAAVAYRARRMRKEMLWAAKHPWIVCSPEAAWFLRLSNARPPAVIVDLGDPAWSVRDLTDLDQADLADADLWLTATPHQADELRADGVTAPVRTIGPLRDLQATTTLPTEVGPDDPVVLSTPPGGWEAVAHTVELVVQLTERAPDLPLVWLTDPGEDRWMADHDLAHIGGRDQVTVRTRDETTPLRPRLIVRTGYLPSDPSLVLAAALEQIPTIGFVVDDLPDLAALAVPPFAVEALADRTLALLDDDRRRVLGTELAGTVRAHLDPHFQLEPLYEVLRPSVEFPPAEGA